MVSSIACILGIIFVAALACRTPKETKRQLRSYYRCLEEQFDRRLTEYIDEEKDDYHRAALTCFLNSSVESTPQGCTMNLSEMDIGVFEGPFKDCPSCQQMLGIAVGAYFAKRNDGSFKCRSRKKRNQRRARPILQKAIDREMDYCMQQRGLIGSEGSSFIEDYQCDDTGSGLLFVFRQLNLHQRLNSCNSRAQVVKKCLRNPFAGYLGKRCKVLTHCYTLHAVGSCATVFPELLKARCDCNDKVVDDARAALNALITVFRELEIGAIPEEDMKKRISDCVTRANQHLITPANNWQDVFVGMGLHRVIAENCEAVLKDPTEGNREEFIRFLEFTIALEGLRNHRSRISCGDEYCPLF